MDSLVIASKLESLRRCVKRIEERRAASADELRASPDLQDIVSLNITRAVQLCVDLAVHVIDWDIVHAITREGLEDFRRFAAAISSRTGLPDHAR